MLGRYAIVELSSGRLPYPIVLYPIVLYPIGWYPIGWYWRTSRQNGWLEQKIGRHCHRARHRARHHVRHHVHGDAGLFPPPPGPGPNTGS